MGDIHIRIDEEPIIIRMEPASIYPIPFTSLTDAPTTYHDQANKFVKVKAAEDGLEFVVAAGLTDELVKYDAGDTVAGYLADKIIAGTGISLSEGTGADENKLKITGTGSYSLPIATGAALGGIKVGTRLTIDPVTGILSADVQTSSMTYPDAGIPLSTGTAWGTSIINNSGNWNTAYGWGNHAGLYLPISGAGDIYTHNASEFALTAHNHSGTYEVPLTFGSGVTRTVNAVANDLITGKAGGQTITFGTAASDYGIYKSTTGAGTPTGIAHQWTGGTNGGAVIATMLNNGNHGIGTTGPTARLHLPAGTATAGTSATKWTPATSVLLTAPEVGAWEPVGDNISYTISTGTARKQIVMTDGANLTSGRIPVATTNGRLIDSATIVGKLSDATAIALLVDTANWTLGLYTGTAIAGTYEGQYYKNDDYYFIAYSDNDWIRLPRA